MKLAAIYNVFDGEELLEGSISQIRKQVDLIIAIVQNIGNFGEEYSGGMQKCKELKEKGIIDIVEHYTPVISSRNDNGTQNEKKKREIGLKIALREKCTHFLFIDCDEFYNEDQFKEAKNFIQKNNPEGTVVKINTYYKFPNWQIEGFETYFVPFIHTLNHDIKCGVEKYPFNVDPTRTVNLQDIVELSDSLCVMHHYSWIRKNIERKLSSSSSLTYIKKHRKTLMEDYHKARPGIPIRHWNNKKLLPVKNYFNINIGDHLTNKEDIRICIKFPTRSRPEKFFSVLDKYLDLMNNKNDYFIIVSCDSDDKTMNNADVINKFKNYKNLFYYFGENKNKIEAVNANIHSELDFDILLLASDDMIPQLQGYDDILREKMYTYFPDTDGVLWFNDGYQGKALNTLCILGKKYYQRFNYIYHPSYVSLWCDSEFTEVSQMLEKEVYFDQVIISHDHPATQKENTLQDELLVRNDSFASRDRKNYEERKKKNFDLTLTEKKPFLKKVKSFFYR